MEKFTDRLLNIFVEQVNLIVKMPIHSQLFDDKLTDETRARLLGPHLAVRAVHDRLMDRLLRRPMDEAERKIILFFYDLNRRSEWSFNEQIGSVESIEPVESRIGERYTAFMTYVVEHGSLEMAVMALLPRLLTRRSVYVACIGLHVLTSLTGMDNRGFFDLVNIWADKLDWQGRQRMERIFSRAMMFEYGMNLYVCEGEAADYGFLDVGYARVLAVSGSDSGGGAGAQADIKTIQATGGYAASALAAVTVQNTVGVSSVYALDADLVVRQIEAVLTDIGADAVKIGMLSSATIVAAVARALRAFDARNIVLDPVMISTSGHRLIEDDAIEMLCRELCPMATLITPNIPEAEVLTGRTIATEQDVAEAGEMLGLRFGTSVLVKAGHLESGYQLTDYLFDINSRTLTAYRSERINTPNTHGTGCTLSSAIASYLAQGLPLAEAVAHAKAYLDRALQVGSFFTIGSGHGPVGHSLEI